MGNPTMTYDRLYTVDEHRLINGVEHAKDPDQGEVTTSEVPEDDVPGEYEDRDKI